MAFGKFRIRGFEVRSSVASVGFVDGANCFIGPVGVLNQCLRVIIDVGKERVIEVGFTVGQVVAGNGKQLLVGVGEDVEPRFIGDFSALVADVKEGGRGRVVKRG